MHLKPFSIDNVKGWTRATCVAFIALALSDLDLSDSSKHPILEPLHRVLDKAWLLPMHVAWIAKKNNKCIECFLLLVRKPCM